MPSAPPGGLTGASVTPVTTAGGATTTSDATASSSIPVIGAAPSRVPRPSDGAVPQTGQRPPPPPPPRPTHCRHGRLLPGINPEVTANDPIPNEETQAASDPHSAAWWQSWNKKYVLLCGTCGLSSIFLGTFYLIIYFVLRSYTSSLEFFQTMPTYIPACVLTVTGVAVLAFMSRKNRLSYVIKAVGCCCLVCAVVCVIVTVTTTVLHMNRLQTLRECTFYTQLHSCTCLPFTDDEPFELKLDRSITTCDVIHGPLYSCLRAMFGVSVIGILVSIFSCMLVYQLLSHEKKKMYWAQLEHRRRFLSASSRRMPGSCSCFDEYGFASSSELYNYPWGIWEAGDERFWGGGAQMYSPNGEDSSTASRSVLLGGANQSSAPSLWLPWGGAWGATGAQIHNPGQRREAQTPVESAGVQDHDGAQCSDDSRPQTTGVLLRPFIPRGLEARFGLRRQHPPGSHNRRPLSDPGIALQLQQYPPPFSEAYLPPIAYRGLEAFPRFMWDPPPPYSQPTSSDNIVHHMGSPARHPIASPQGARGVPAGCERGSAHALAEMMRGDPGSPVSGVLPSSNPDGTPSNKREGISLEEFALTGPLPINHRLRRLPLSHVKSLGDVTEGKRVESLEVLYCDGKDTTTMLDRFPSQGDIPHHKVFTLKNKHLKSISDPKSVYFGGRLEQESELYFADVSSCVSLHHDGEDGMYYSEPTSSGSQKTPSPENEKTPEVNHLYEQVRDINQIEEDEEGSHHTSDDTMIVHTSSSDHSNGLDMENTYSVISPVTDQSSASPMATDTDAYSCYNSVASPPINNNNLNLDPNHLRRHPIHRLLYPVHQHDRINRPNPIQNDNDCLEEKDQQSQEPRYEIIPGGDDCASSRDAASSSHKSKHPLPPGGSSDLNGNVALSSTSTSPSHVPTSARATARLSLSLRGAHLGSPETAHERRGQQNAAEDAVNPCSFRDGSSSGSPRKVQYNARTSYLGSQQPNSPERRLHTLQDLLYPLKSVNV